MYCKQRLKEHLRLIYTIFWKHSEHFVLTCSIFFLDVKKRNLLYAVYLKIHFPENSCLVCRLLFLTDYLLLMIEFRIRHAKFKLFFESLANVFVLWFLIKNIEENIHGYVLSCSVSNLDLLENALTVLASKYLNESVFSMLIYLINKMINCLLELAITN